MKDNKNDYWACACVKRGHDGKLAAIKLNAPTVKRCRVCKCTPLAATPPGAKEGEKTT